MFKNKIHRFDIDFLRAVSVIAVIIYHAELKFENFSIFKGGFLGVDIFFVISGFLITKILTEENTGILNFFERRIRRIFPMLILVLIVSSFFAWKYLYPSDLVSFSESVISSILFISNYFFWIIGQQYGAQTSINLPLLHTWRDKCITHDDKNVFYDDTYHLSSEGIKLISKDLVNELSKSFINTKKF